MNQPSQGVITIQRPGQFFAAGLRDFIVRIDGRHIALAFSSQFADHALIQEPELLLS